MLKVLRPAIARILTPVGQVLARTPVTPNALTIIGTIGMSAGALWLFPTGHLFAGVMVCTGFVLTDMLDGTLARIKGTTGKFGAFLDSTMDRIADASVFVGLAAWFVLRGNDKLLAGVAVFCLVSGSLVSYAKARAESVGLKCDVGFAERTERLLIALVATGLSGLGVPYVLAIGLWALAVASTVTFFQRVLAARRSAAEIAAADSGVAGTAAPTPHAPGEPAGGQPSAEDEPSNHGRASAGGAPRAGSASAEAGNASATGGAAADGAPVDASAGADRGAGADGGARADRGARADGNAGAGGNAAADGGARSASAGRAATAGPAADQRDTAPGG